MDFEPRAIPLHFAQAKCPSARLSCWHGMMMPGLPPSSFFCFPQRSLNASDREKGGRFGIPLEQFNASSE